MDDIEILLAKIIAEPNSDQFRLELADWYESQPSLINFNQEHAHFIRNQLQIYAIEQSAGPKFQLYDLCASTKKMLEKNATEWNKPFIPVVSSVAYHRGCVELIRCSAEQFKNAGHLFSIAPIRHLDLIINDPEELQLIDQPHLVHIQSLSFDKCTIGDLGVSYLGQLTYLKNLQWLSLEQNKINEDGVENLIRMENFDKLKYVNLIDNPCNPIEEFAQEFGAITDVWLPEVGKELELRHGRVSWFHRDGEDIASWYANRFQLISSSILAIPEYV